MLQSPKIVDFSSLFEDLIKTKREENSEGALFVVFPLVEFLEVKKGEVGERSLKAFICHQPPPPFFFRELLSKDAAAG